MSVSLKRQRTELHNTVAAAPRTGRPSTLTDETAAQLREVNKGMRTRGVAAVAVALGAAGVLGAKRWGKAGPAQHPSEMCVARWMKQVKYANEKVRPRPIVSGEEGALHRVRWAQSYLDRADKQDQDTDLDEKVWPVPLPRKLRRHPDSDPEDEAHRREFFTPAARKQGMPSVMAFAILSKPVLKQGSLTLDDRWERSGKVGIFRCTKLKEGCNGKKKKDAAGNTVREKFLNEATGRWNTRDVYEIESGGTKEVDGTMDGEMMARMMIEKGIPAITSYFEDGPRPTRGRNHISQEDGAPGHGYNNKANNEKDGRPGKATGHHARYEAAAKAAGIDIDKQSARTPEGNGHDLGAWSMQATGVVGRYYEFVPYFKKKPDLLNLLWKVIEEEFWAMPPEKIFSIFEHKIDVCKEIIRLEGAALRKEPHAGARKRTRAAIEAARGLGAVQDSAIDLSSDSESD